MVPIGAVGVSNWMKRFSEGCMEGLCEEAFGSILIDFPREKSEQVRRFKQNNALAKQYAVRGFPTVLLLNQEGTLIEKTGYQRGGAENYIEHIKELIGDAEKEK